MAVVYGQNRVPPERLFDPETGAPPPDAFDVQFRMPLSLAAWVDQLYREGRLHELGDVQGSYERLIDTVVDRVQLMCGYVGAHVGGQEPARLAITTVVEPRIAGLDDELRPHAHVYVGGTATRLRDEQPRPVDEGWLRQGLFGAVFPDYENPLEDGTAERYGLVWERSHGGVHEVVNPPWANERVPGMRRLACPGPWGPRRLVLADESYLHGCARDEAIIAHQRAIGYPGAD